MKTLVHALLLGAALCFVACGGDDDEDGDAAGAGGTSSGGTTSGESGATGSDSLCRRGCVETLAADCQNGPSSQEECEEDCEALTAGSCGESPFGLAARNPSR